MKLTTEQLQAAIAPATGTSGTPSQAPTMLDRIKAAKETASRSEKKGILSSIGSFLNKDFTGAAGDVIKGAAKGVGSTLYSAGTMMEKGMEKLTGRPAITTSIAGRNIGGMEEKPQWLTPQNTAQKIGYTGEQIGEFFLPGSAATKIGKVAELAVKGAPKLAKLAGFGVRSLAEGGIISGQTMAQTGDVGESLNAALLGFAMPTAGKILGTAGKGLKTTIKATLGKTTGAGKAAIEEAFANPNVMKFAREAGAEGAEGLQRRAVEESKKALGMIRESRGTAYRAELKKIKANPMQMDDAAIKMRQKAADSLDEFGIKIDPEGKALGKNLVDFGESTIIEHQAVADKALNDVFTWKDWSPAGMDTLKKRLYDFRNQARYGTPAHTFVNNIAKNLDTSLKEMVPGYEKMTTGWRESSELITEMEKALSLGNKASMDTAVRKLQSIMRDNNEVRKELVDVLTKTGGKDITGMMAGAALAPLAPRGIVAGTGLSIGIGASILNPASWPLAIAYLGASSPRLVGEFVNLMGKAARGADGLIKLTPGLKQNVDRLFNDAEAGFKKGTGLAPEIKGAIEGFGAKGEKAVTDFIKKPKIGLGIEDVSGGKPNLFKDRAVGQTALESEAKKYKSADEFVKAQPTLSKTERQAVESSASMKAYINDQTPLGKGVEIHEAIERPIYFDTPRGGNGKIPAGHTEAINAEVNFYKTLVPELSKFKNSEIDNVVVKRLQEKYGKGIYGNELSKPITFEAKNATEKEIYNLVKNKLEKIDTKSQLTDIYKKAVGETPKQLEPLAKEAKKYKSAEEFVKAQGTKLYHGGGEDIKIFKDTGRGGVFLTPDKKMAQNHADFAEFRGKNSVITEAVATPKNVYKIPKGNNSFSGLDNNVIIEQPEYHTSEINRIKAKGYDAIQSSDGKQLFVFDVKNVKTKSQLTDIWKKSQPLQEGGLIQEAKKVGADLEFINRKPTKAEMLAGKYKQGKIQVYLKNLDGTPKSAEQIADTVQHEIGHHIDYQRRGIIAGPMGDSIRGWDGKLRPAMDSDVYFRNGTKVEEAQNIRKLFPRKDGFSSTQKEIYADAYKLYSKDKGKLKEIAPNIYKEIDEHILNSQLTDIWNKA